MEQNYSHHSITFWVKMFSDLCVHPTFHPPLPSFMGSIKACTRFLVDLGGSKRTPVPFYFARVFFRLGRVSIDVPSGWRHPLGAIG